MNPHVQNFGKVGRVVAGQDPLAAFHHYQLGGIEFDAIRCEPGHHVIRRRFKRCDYAEAVAGNGDAAALAFLFRHEILEGASILILFGTGIVLAGNKIARLRMRPSSQKPINLLCADAQTLVGEAVARVFTTGGYHVERVQDGLSAWEKLSVDPTRYHVVITEHTIPLLNGLLLVERLRDVRFPGRIIVYSAAISPDEDLAYRRLSVDAIVENGPDSAKLLAIVEAFHAGGT